MATEEVSEELEVINELGLHARPAATLVQTVLRFESEVRIAKEGHVVNAKSIMGLLTLIAPQGTKLVVTCSGPDAHEAMAAVRALLQRGFGEE